MMIERAVTFVTRIPRHQWLRRAVIHETGLGRTVQDRHKTTQHHQQGRNQDHNEQNILTIMRIASPRVVVGESLLEKE